METEENEMTKSLWETTQEKARLFNCFRCCRRGDIYNDEDAVDQAAMLDESQIMDNSVLFEDFETNQAQH